MDTKVQIENINEGEPIEIADVLFFLILQNTFLLSQIYKINKLLRMQSIDDKRIDKLEDVKQTHSSFNYQWKDFNFGAEMSSDKIRTGEIEKYICKITDTPESWFKGKSILDVGCGSGRYSYGFLKMGAKVHSIDISEWGIKRTKELCEEFSPNHTCKIEDILNWEDETKYDFVFCFGVVHHTGNVYQAIINVADRVKEHSSKLFLMVYGIPRNKIDFAEVVNYITIHDKLQCNSFDEKKQILMKNFGHDKAHGFFDAISPEIADLLTYGEIVDLLSNLGFKAIRKLSVIKRNHLIIAIKE